MNGPCVIQQSNNHARIISHANGKSLVNSALSSNTHHEMLNSSASDGQLRVGVALSRRSGNYSALTFEACDYSRAFGFTRLEGVSHAQQGCGLILNLKVEVTHGTLVVNWSISRCTISGLRPLEYKLLIEKPARERSGANVGNFEFERLDGFDALLTEECGLARFSRDKIITEGVLYLSLLHHCATARTCLHALILPQSKQNWTIQN